MSLRIVLIQEHLQTTGFRRCQDVLWKTSNLHLLIAHQRWQHMWMIPA